MTIALIAHDSKKELMVQFCTAYCRILSQHKLVATGTTGKLIAEATGLQVQRFLAGVQGGDQQIASRIACNEIDLLLFFRDPINAKPSEPNEMTLLRLCDVHNIPMATNIATAEVLIHGLERGDLDWRDIVHPQNLQNDLEWLRVCCAIFSGNYIDNAKIGSICGCSRFSFSREWGPNRRMHFCRRAAVSAGSKNSRCRVSQRPCL